MTNKDFLSDINDGIKSWEIKEFTIDKGSYKITYGSIRCFSLYYYYPYSQEDTDSDHMWERIFIWNFKDGKNSEEVASQTIRVLKHFFLEETLSNLTLVCIPASTEEKNRLRYYEFAKKVAEECDMWNAFEHIGIKYDREAKHEGGESDYCNLKFDESWFKEKNIIIFDDIITRGNSIRSIKKRLEQLGATVIGAITLGKTVHHECGEHPFNAIDLSEKPKKEMIKTKNKISSSALESVALYKETPNVRKIAIERGLKETTVYGHLFTAGVLDPYDFISEQKLKDSYSVYENEKETPSQKLDEFLNSAEKAAFFHLYSQIKVKDLIHKLRNL